MTAQGHLLFSVTCALLAHKLPLTPALADANLGQTMLAALATSLLPDLDHPKSVLGQKVRWISVPLSRLFGHRGFTHSLLAVALCAWGLGSNAMTDLMPVAVKDALILGYLSHLLGDWLTPAGIPLLWPIKQRFRLPGWPLRSGSAMETGFCTLSLLIAGYWAY
ncbi:metal-dependent hydrolase [Aeromonas bivalvium]|uniref:metal-dependent hydrolase n=1 Tax=Aeromonas bivalvium TaxID=440079 RepID=UPI000DCF841D|nr:metal-dependent hydrolase [Aeromonas bivalvium]